MITFTEKELNILYFAMTRVIQTQKKVVNWTDEKKLKYPNAHVEEVQALNELTALQQKLDGVVFGRNKSPEIVD